MKRDDESLSVLKPFTAPDTSPKRASINDVLKVQLLEVAAISQRVEILLFAISQQLLAIGLKNPPPPVRYRNQHILFLLAAFWGPPSSLQCGRHMRKPLRP